MLEKIKTMTQDPEAYSRNELGGSLQWAVQEIERLRKVVRYYAEPSNYQYRASLGSSYIESDRGYKAREALKGEYP